MLESCILLLLPPNNLISTSLILHKSSLSPRDSNDSDSSLDFSLFDYLLPSNNDVSDPTLHEEDQVLLGPGEELIIPMPLYEDMLHKSMSSDAEGAFSSSMSSEGSSRYGPDEELSTNNPCWEFLDELKYPSKEVEIEEVDKGEEESEEVVDQENEKDNFDYDGDDEN